MSVHVDDDLDDELALFEQQIQQVSTAASASLQKPAPQAMFSKPESSGQIAENTTTKPPSSIDLNTTSVSKRAGVSTFVQPVISVPSYDHSDTLHSASKSKSFTQTKPLNRPYSYQSATASDPPPTYVLGAQPLRSTPNSVPRQAAPIAQYVQSTQPVHSARKNVTVGPSRVPEPDAVVSGHSIEPSVIAKGFTGNDQQGSIPTTGPGSSTHRWYWNGQTWLWIARDAIPASPNTGEMASMAARTTFPAASIVETSFTQRNPAATKGLIAGVVPVLVDNAAGLSASTAVASTAGSEGSSSEMNSTSTFKRTAAGGVWKDPSLEEWPSNDHRLFVGDLGPDASDVDLTTAFSKYPSFNMARVVKDKRSSACRGYGFVSFSSAHDMLAAIREMNGKYVGSRPIKLQRSTWQKRNLSKEKWKQVRAIRTIAKR